MQYGTLTSLGFAMIMALSAGSVGCSQQADAGTGSTNQSEDDLELRLFPVSKRTVDEARSSHDPVKIANVLYTLAADRTALPWNYVGLRIDRTRQLFDGLDAGLVAKVRAAYIVAHDEDPEVTICSDGFLEPIAQLDRNDELEMVGALKSAQMTADVDALADMRERADSDGLTQDDRSKYFAMLPRIGLWGAPVRAAEGDRSLDALERLLLARTWTARGLGNGDLDAALASIEAKLPAADLTRHADRSKSVAVVASSHGAQWQELMGWGAVMVARGYHLQVFTPDGHPVAFQHDSMSVSPKTAPLGFGCPSDLDPAGPTGQTAADLLSHTAPAASFDATQFGAVYLAGGLGFNEDVAVARPGASGTTLTANANIARLMQGAIAEKLPIVALCHGPTLFAATPIDVDGRTSMLNEGIETASLPPFESYVGFTGRKEIQFTYDVNTHQVLAAVGGHTNVLADIANMSRVVSARKADMDIITGPGPQAASNLAQPTIDALARKWGN
jgi:putative intracellular protease/amidase